MFKPQRPIAGSLQQPISSYAAWVTVSDSLAALITLGVGDWTYLVIENGSEAEVVKVTQKAGSVLTIVRGQEDTAPTTFPAGALIYYVLTLSAIRDTVQTTALALSATGIASVSNGIVHVAIPNVLGFGDIESVGRERAQIVDSHAFTGCKIVICGQVAVGPFYLTSKQYPIEVIENLVSTADWIRGRLNVAPVDNIASSGAWLTGNLRALLVTYTNWPPENISSSGAWLTGDLRTVLITYTNWPPENIYSSADWLTGDIRTVLITYTNWPAENISSTAAWVSGTLT